MLTTIGAESTYMPADSSLQYMLCEHLQSSYDIVIHIESIYMHSVC